jgi:hypothetical protein
VAAKYPTEVKRWTSRKDLVDLVVADDVNTAYDEITAIEDELGSGGVKTSPTWGSSSFTSGTTVWDNLKARLANIENGVYTAFNQRVATTGGSTIQSTGNSVVSLTVKAKTSQTANLIEVKNSSDTVVASVSTAGTLFATKIDGGTA